MKALKSWDVKQLLLCLCLTIIVSLFFFEPMSKIIAVLDREAFNSLNKSLENNFLKYFFGYLNHPYEKTINVFFMFAINAMAYFYSRKQDRSHVLKDIISLWLTLEIWLLIVHFVSRDTLDLMRSSPSMSLPVHVWLNKELAIPEIKVTATSSFPGGHAFAVFYWFFYSRRFSNNILRTLALIIAVIVSLPRIFSGAHWLTDVLFSIYIAYIFVKIDFATPFCYYIHKFIEYIKNRVKKCV